MAAEVDVLVSDALGADVLADVAADLSDWGLRPRMMRMPRRRGVAEYSWLLMLSIPAETLAKVMLERLGGEVYDGLRKLVERVARRHPDEPASAPARQVVVEAADTGAQFLLRSDLSAAAYQQLVEEISSRAAGPGQWVFDDRLRRWRLSAPA